MAGNAGAKPWAMTTATYESQAQSPAQARTMIPCVEPATRKKLGEELWSKFKPWGHIVVRVYPEGNNYQVFVLDADSTDYRIKYKSEIVNL